MGVGVTYEDWSVILKGSDQIYKCGAEIDMGVCTDSFIALSVILAFKTE